MSSKERFERILKDLKSRGKYYVPLEDVQVQVLNNSTDKATPKQKSITTK